MDLKRKIEIMEASLASISGHTDEDAAVRLAALDRVIERARDHKAAVQVEVANRNTELFGPSVEHVRV